MDGDAATGDSSIRAMPSEPPAITQSFLSESDGEGEWVLLQRFPYASSTRSQPA